MTKIAITDIFYKKKQEINETSDNKIFSEL